MPKIKLTPELRKIILKEKRKSPHIGVREIAAILADKYKAKLSKSLIHNLLKNKGLKDKPGRKSGPSFQGRKVEPCGFLLLRALDSQVGLLDYLAERLETNFSELNPERLKKIITLASFSFFHAKTEKTNLRKTGLLRLAGIYQISKKELELFNQTILAKQPVVNLDGLKKELEPVSAIKFIFKNGSFGFSDGRLATFWDKPQALESFSSPLRVVRQKIQNMLAQKVLLIGYTKSFNYLSATAFNFLRGLNSGLTALEFLGPAGKALDRLKLSPNSISLIFGYSPQLFMPPATHQGPHKFKRFFHEEVGELFLAKQPAAFRLEGTTITLSHIQIKNNLNSSVFWGLLGNASLRELSSISRYFYLWPYLSDDFFKETEMMAQIQKVSRPNGLNFAKMLPQKVVFTQPIDFIRVGQILSLLFKETVQGWEPKEKAGNFSRGKNYVKITLRQAPPALKRAFNQAVFEIDGRPAFIG